MERKAKGLPLLSGSKSKTTLLKDRLKIEDLFLANTKNRNTHKDYRHDDDFAAMRASNFLSRIQSVESPQIIFAVADQVKEIVRDKINKQNMNNTMDLFNCREADISNNKSTVQRATQQSTVHRGNQQSTVHRANQQNKKVLAEERNQAINLARWMDDKLKVMREKKHIAFMDILDYKQTVLNYGLGRIIESLSKKCREEGQILALIWNNTFTMFQSVFEVLIDAATSKEIQKNQQAKQLHTIFQTNHHFLIEQNQELQKQNNQIFQKMRSVIAWNKKLRRERKQLTTANKIMDYRIVTYSQALEQSLEMLLQSTPEPNQIQMAKKIMAKLGRQKNKKKRFFKQQVDEQLGKDTKELVFSWLQKNSYIGDQKLQIFKQTFNGRQDRFMFSQIDDINDMKQVDIYDFFRLYDVAVQAVPEITNTETQVQPKQYTNVEVMTRNMSTMEHGVQTMPMKHDSKASIQIMPSKKHVEIASKQSNRSKYYKDKNKTPLKREAGMNSTKNVRQSPKTQEKDYDWEKQHYERQNKDLRRRSNRQARDKQTYKYGVQTQNTKEEVQQFKPAELLQIKKIEEEHESDRAENTSITDMLQEQIRTKGQITTKNLITNSCNGRDRSLYDFDNYNSLSNKAIGVGQNITMRRNNHKRSVAYIRNDPYGKPINRLNNKKFTDTYKEQRQIMENNKEQFYDTIIRRRSFYTKKRVEFATYKEAEEVGERSKEFMRGGKLLRGYQKQWNEGGNQISLNIDRLTKRMTVPSNMAKTKTLYTSKCIFQSITGGIQQIARMPPKNKVFVNNNLISISKYVSALIFDYLRQLRKQKEELPIQCEKALYPLSILLMERMTFRYGLKDIADKKIKNFIQKILTFASVSEKVGLYSLLLGLEDDEVGSDQLLVYLKCLVYFDTKKLPKDSSAQSTTVDIETVRQHISSILQYFFDHQYVSLLELKLEIFFQQNAPFVTVEGIATLIIKQLLRRKKDLKLKYLKVHQLCTHGDNFFTNIFKMLKVINNYRVPALKEIDNEGRSQQGKEKESNIDLLRDIRNRGYKKNTKNDKKILNSEFGIFKIGEIIKQLLKRSDIIDQQYGKSITAQRFITAAMLYNIPNIQDTQVILSYFQNIFTHIQKNNPYYQGMNCQQHKSVDKLAKVWNKQSVQKSQEAIGNWWTFVKVYSDKVQKQVQTVMGKIGIMGVHIQTSLFNISTA